VDVAGRDRLVARDAFARRVDRAAGTARAVALLFGAVGERLRGAVPELGARETRARAAAVVADLREAVAQDAAVGAGGAARVRRPVVDPPREPPPGVDAELLLGHARVAALRGVAGRHALVAEDAALRRVDRTLRSARPRRGGSVRGRRPIVVVVLVVVAVVVA